MYKFYFTFIMICISFIGCASFSNSSEEITVYIPRDLFFIGGSEDHFLSFFHERGGQIGILDEDTQTFWRNYSTNMGNVDIEVIFSRSDLTAIGLEMESDLNMHMEAITNTFASILTFERKITEIYTKFVIRASLDEFREDMGIIELLDFVFPYMGVIEYLYRIFNQHDMAVLREIAFYLEDNETSELFGIYSFFHDAPRGLGIRHGIGF